MRFLDTKRTTTAVYMDFFMLIIVHFLHALHAYPMEQHLMFAICHGWRVKEAKAALPISLVMFFSEK